MAALLTKYFNTYHFDGNGNLLLVPAEDVSAFSKVNLEIYGQPIPGHNITVNVVMGVISGSTLASTVLSMPLSTATTIHTFNVIGPQMQIMVQGGPPNGSIALEAWTFLQ